VSIAVDRMFFTLNSWELGLILLAVVVGAAALGVVAGRYLRKHSETLREPFGVLQAALLGVVGLILAFGLSLAVGRYETRRAAVVDEANAIGTTYLRAQTLAEPNRSRSLALLKRYADTSIHLSKTVPGSREQKDTVAVSGELQRRLWRLAGRALDDSPIASAPRLYVDSLNTMFDAQTTRVAARNNRVPSEVLTLELVAAAAALGLLAVYLSILGRGVIAVLLAAVLVTALLLVTFDLDRPTRGFITVPDTPLTNVRDSMVPPPAATGPSGP
jgi:hypothetical protein